MDHQNASDHKVSLGQDCAYPAAYDNTLLHPIARAAARVDLFGSASPAFYGSDVWTAYELSWLDPKGKPQVRIAEFIFASDSTNIVESKSFKYYLNSFNDTCFESDTEVSHLLQQDLAQASGGAVEVRLDSVDQGLVMTQIPGQCVDDIPCHIEHYTPSAALLCTANDELVEQKQLYSHLLKSNCPVTGQPDWATLWIEYSGAKILPESFLKYVVAYRRHQDFHESCVEKIYQDIWQRCQPQKLSVYARYTRRGGLDINPFRSSEETAVPFGRLLRQ